MLPLSARQAAINIRAICVKMARKKRLLSPPPCRLLMLRWCRHTLHHITIDYATYVYAGFNMLGRSGGGLHLASRCRLHAPLNINIADVDIAADITFISDIV